MVSLAPGHINIFALGTDHSLYWRYGYGKSWTGWHRGGQQTWLFEPITVSRVLNEISVFMVARNGALHQSNFDLMNTGELGPWKNIGGQLSGPPALAKRHAGIIHIFHIGKDRAIHHKAWDGVVYTPRDEFEKLPGEFSHSPTAVSTGQSDVSVFGIGLDNHLHRYQWKSNGGWGPIEELPGHWAASPKAVSDQEGFIDVFGIDADGNITRVFCRNDKDWKLETIPGTFQSLDAISFSPGVIDIFALGKNKEIYHRTLRNDTWEEWSDLKGMMNKPPTVVTGMPDPLGVMCVGEGGVVYYKVKNRKTKAWGEWYKVGGVIITRVG